MVDLQIDHYGPVSVLSLDGRLDHDSSQSFQSALIELMKDSAAAGQAGVIVDFSQITYMSSIGLRALMVGSKAGNGSGIGFAVASPSETVEEVLRISRANMFLSIHTSLRDAIAGISEEAVQLYDQK